MTSLISHRARPLTGETSVPGDKSISHRALIIGALAVGETHVMGLLEADDVMRTADALRALGAAVGRDGGAGWRVSGRGVGGLAEPSRVLDLGNSGTGARLLMGVLSGHPFASVVTGDASLSARPMGRVMEPLERMGAAFRARSGGRLPVAVTGADDLVPIVYELPVPSAQVKSAVLLAGLHAPGETTVIEPRPTRDHTERMLTHFGAEVRVEPVAAGGRRIALSGQPELAAQDLVVPGDLSSAAFPLVAAVLVPGSRLNLRGVGVNPLRSGLLETLREMAATITVANRRESCGEPVADLVIEAGGLRGTDVPAERAPAMIDEYPVLAVAAACADGVTRMHGLGELRVKESDRLSAIARGLAACGVRVEEGADSLVIHGNGQPPPGGAEIGVALDHRVAMAFLVLGMVSASPVAIDDATPIETSFPGFVDFMNALGARIEGEVS